MIAFMIRGRRETLASINKPMREKLEVEFALVSELTNEVLKNFLKGGGGGGDFSVHD